MKKTLKKYLTKAAKWEQALTERQRSEISYDEARKEVVEQLLKEILEELIK